MTPQELLQISDSSIAITAGLLSLIYFVWSWRKNSIELLRKDLSLVWTNEGDIQSSESSYIDLALKLEYGNLFGSLSSPQTDEIFDVHVTPGWFSANASITLMCGRASIPIANVKLKLRGNRNRLRWILCTKDAPSFLPRESELWPSPIQ